MPKTDLQKHIDKLVRQHKGLRAAARALEIDPAYLWRLQQGRTKNPGGEVLERLGLKRTEKLVAL
jgi:hypothetical protein